MNARVVIVLGLLTGCSALIGFDPPAERGAQCSDGVDNDGNGLRDCEESSCASMCVAACGEGVNADASAVDPVTGHCYLAFATGQGVFAANDACMALGGYLAVPDGPAEDALIRSAAPPDAAIGIADVNETAGRDFRQVTGDRPAQYLNFTPGQPDGGLGILCLSYDGLQPTWKDNDCETPRPYVCEITQNACGDLVRQPDEGCDDGNGLSSDGCAATCVDEDECTLGIDNCSPDADCVNEAWSPGRPGFNCQCRSGFIGDGVTCTALPPAPVFTTRAPVTLPNLVGCGNGIPRRGHKISIDPFGALYVVQLCPSSTSAMVTVSVDAGATWSPPVQVGADVVEASVIGIQPGRAAVAMIHGATGDVVVRQTFDFGMTWQPERPVFAGVDPVPGLSTATDGVNLLVGVHPMSGGYRVQRSLAPDLQAFVGADTTSVAFGDVLVDPQNVARVYAVGDTDMLHVSESTDGGFTFGADVMPDATQQLSDWGIGGGFIVTAGQRNDATRMPLTSLTTVEVGAGLQDALGGERSIVVGDDGTAYVAYGSGVGVHVARWPPVASAAFDPPVVIEPMSDTPAIAVVPGRLVAAVYRSLGDVRFAIVDPILPQ